MRDAMLNHGLDEAKIAQEDGFFVVTLAGPAGNYDRIRTPAVVVGLVTPAIEAQLNDRQRKILLQIQATGLVTSGWCRKQLPITYDTANRDLFALVKLGLLLRKGRGRATKFEFDSSSS